jgi:hypothetical protein
LRESLKAERNTGAVWLGLLSAIKGYPALLSIDYLTKRQFRQFGLFLVTAAIAIVIPLVSYPGELSSSITRISLEILKFRGADDTYHRHNSSLLAFLRNLGQVPNEFVKDLSSLI